MNINNIPNHAVLRAHRRQRGVHSRNEEGNALVELALSLPILMALLTGTASFSLALYNLQQLGNATSGAAQLVAAEQGLITDPCAAVVTSMTQSLPNWNASSFTYTVWITNSGGTATKFGPTTGSSFTCKAGAADMAQNEPITVSVSYAYTWLPIFNFKPSSALTSTATSMAD